MSDYDRFETRVDYHDIFERNSDIEVYDNRDITITQEVKPRRLSKNTIRNPYITDRGVEYDGNVETDGYLVESGHRRISIMSTGSSSLISGSSSVAPNEPVEDFDIYSERKVKPQWSRWRSSRGTAGSSISHEEVLKFMIGERKKMDEEQAALRYENERLKAQLLPSQSLSPQLLNTSRSDATTSSPSLSTEPKKMHRRTSSVSSNISIESINHDLYLETNDSEMGYNESMEKLVIEAERLKIENSIMQEKLRQYQSFDLSLISPITSSQARRQHSPVDNGHSPVLIPRLLWEGGQVWKIPYNSKGPPERRYVTIKRVLRPSQNPTSWRPVVISPDDSEVVGYIANPPTLVWHSGSSPTDYAYPRELQLQFDSVVTSGYSTLAFERLPHSSRMMVPDERLCFSITASTRTLDLAADTVAMASAWKQAFRSLLLVFYTSGQVISSSNISPINAAAATLPPNNSDINQRDKLIRQLFHAAEVGDSAIIKRVVARGISINTVDSTLSHSPSSSSANLPFRPRGDTPLLLACRYGHIDVIKTCLEYGAKNDPHPEYGDTALHISVKSSQYEASRVILSAAQASQADRMIVNLSNFDGMTPLHLACIIGNVDIAELLLHHGADLAGVNNRGKTSLSLACLHGHQTLIAMLLGKFDILRSLTYFDVNYLAYCLDHGADELLEVADRDGNTPLFDAIISNKLAVVRLMLETAANVMHRNHKGQTPYALAANRGQPQIGVLLQEYQQLYKESTTNFHKKSSNIAHVSTVKRNSVVESKSEHVVVDMKVLQEQVYQQKYQKNSSLSTSNTSSKAIKTEPPKSSASTASMAANTQAAEEKDDYYVEKSLEAPKTQSEAKSSSSSSKPIFKTQDSTVLQWPQYDSSPEVSPSNSTTPPIYRTGISTELHTPLTYTRKTSFDTINSSERSMMVSEEVKSGTQSSQVESLDPSYFEESSILLEPAFESSPMNESFNYQEDSFKQDVNAAGQREAELGVESVQDDYSLPLEVFVYGDTEWHAYICETGDKYHYCPSTTQSQWEDPREYGILSPTRAAIGYE
jgi:ankyrin repeat protein